MTGRVKNQVNSGAACVCVGGGGNQETRAFFHQMESAEDIPTYMHLGIRRPRTAL